MNHQSDITPTLAGDAADVSMVGRMRLVLSTSALLTAYINVEGVNGVVGLTWLVFWGYLIHSLVLYILSQLDQPFLQRKLIHWLDVFWYALMVLSTGHSNSVFFLFFFFAILTSSFRWGFEEGARVTLASAGLFTVTSLAGETQTQISQLLLRTTFLLALGYMIAYWGDADVTQKRRLALLRNVGQMANPRFGVDRTIASILENIRAFFEANSCILVMRDSESTTWLLRTAMKEYAGRSNMAEKVTAEAAAPLMIFPKDQIVVYTSAHWPKQLRPARCMVNGSAQSGWIKSSEESYASLAELLEARSFITAPPPLRRGEGRIFVVSSKHGFKKSDAQFLNYIVAQAFPAIENVELLDRLASDAALRERRKIARDLHDTAIQPYIGLRHGLTAVRNKAAADNPLNEDLDKLMTMATQVVGDLRRYARTFNGDVGLSEPVFLTALRRQAAQFREFYGIDIAVSIEGNLDINDRLAAEIFQVVNEGMSNIRKHTDARHGHMRLKCTNFWLNIQIENECVGTPAFNFVPRSIVERAAALGGKAHVEQGLRGKTVVHIDIPV